MPQRILLLTMFSLFFAACSSTPMPRPTVLPAVTVVAMTGVAPAPASTEDSASAQIVPPTFAPAFTDAPSPTPEPEVKSLVVCMPYEPNTLYEYAAGGSRESVMARAAVLDALRDGPIDHRAFDYQPVILQKLPSLKDGDAVVEAATVRDGETIVDAVGNIVGLSAGVRYFDPAGNEQFYDGQAGSVEAMQMTVTFTLLPGLKWEDGQPLTTDDVLFSWELSKSPDTLGANHFLTNRLNDPVVVDAQTIRWTYLPGYKDALYYTRFPVPFPRHLYGALGALRVTPAQMMADENANRKPLSFGAFKLEEWEAGEHLKLSRNPNYFRASEGLPYLDTLTFRFVPDPGQLVAQLLAGTCDVGIGTKAGTQDSIFEGLAPQLLNAELKKTLAPQFIASSTFEHLDFNISPAEGYGGLVGRGLFQNVKIRQAFAYCINRQALVSDLLYGRSEVPPAYAPTTHPLYDPTDITVYEFDPAQGRALLNEAGWQDGDGDGILDKGGQSLSLAYYYGPTDNTLRAAVAQALKTQLKANCGIEINLQELSRSELFDSFPDGALFGRRYDLGQFAWVTDVEPPCALYTSREWPGAGDGQPDQYGVATGYPEGGNNVGYLNPAFEEACFKAINALDPAEKKRLHHEAMKLFAQDVPSLILFAKLKIGAARPDVSGFILDATQSSDLWNVEEFDVAGP